MQKIFIMAHSMDIGGAERSLLGLLENIDTSKYSVDLFLLRHEGELLPYLPPNIKLLPPEPHYSSLGVPLKSVIIHGQFGVAIGRILGKYMAKRRLKQLKINSDNNVNNEYSHKYTLKSLPRINDEKYDLAISYMSPHYFVAQKIAAKKKIAWIHTDYSTFAVDRESELRMWDAYNYIASISDEVTSSFLKTFPELGKKIVLIPNIIPIGIVSAQAGEKIHSSEMGEDGSIRLLSVGRFCAPKNFDNVPEICRMIREEGFNIKWYLIGYGSDEQLIKKKIAESGMKDFVIILGKKENPYPYISACDLYVQPSRYEGKCVSVIEAQLLHKPVVITNYPTSSSQLEDGVDGVIVPIDNQGCADGICKILSDPELRDRLSRNTRNRDYVNASSINQLHEILENIS